MGRRCTGQRRLESRDLRKSLAAIDAPDELSRSGRSRIASTKALAIHGVGVSTYTRTRSVHRAIDASFVAPALEVVTDKARGARPPPPPHRTRPPSRFQRCVRSDCAAIDSLSEGQPGNGPRVAASVSLASTSDEQRPWFKAAVRAGEDCATPRAVEGACASEHGDVGSSRGRSSSAQAPV